MAKDSYIGESEESKVPVIQDFSDFNKRALFIHIPKTSGASISKAPFILKQATPDRPPDTEFLQNLPLRFSFVRNPYDRVASVILNLGWATEDTFEKFVLEELPKYREVIEKGGRGSTNKGAAKRQQLWTMSEYLFFNNKLVVDIVGRFENLQQDWNKVCKLMNCDFELPHENKSEWGNYDRFYTPETKAVVGVAYAEDFVNFGYKRQDK